MPEDVRDVIGKALLQAQFGGQAPIAKPLHGFGGASVLEIVDDFEGSTYRLVYTIKHPMLIYGIHAFMKKSHHGAETPKNDTGVIKGRLRVAEEHYATFSRKVSEAGKQSKEAAASKPQRQK